MFGVARFELLLERYCCSIYKLLATSTEAASQLQHQRNDVRETHNIVYIGGNP